VLRDRRDLALENLALRQQLAVFKQSTKRPRLSKADRAFWVVLSRTWKDWKDALLIVKPETVIAWHRKGFRLYWTWKSRRRVGRQPVDPEVRDLIRRMSAANVTWGAPRIHGELLKLGIQVSQTTVAKYMLRVRKPPSQTWRTCLDNHVRDLVSMDFFVVPTATFRVLFVVVILAHHRRRLVHFNVTENPTARWTAYQVVEAFPWDTALAAMGQHRAEGCDLKKLIAYSSVSHMGPGVHAVRLGERRVDLPQRLRLLRLGHERPVAPAGHLGDDRQPRQPCRLHHELAGLVVSRRGATEQLLHASPRPLDPEGPTHRLAVFVDDGAVGHGGSEVDANAACKEHE